MTEPSLDPSQAGRVVLDIGGDTGALILHAPAALLGREIDLTPAGAPGAPGTHALVRERQLADGVSFAAVYPALPAGEYVVWRDGSTPVGFVTISGGQVTRHHWEY